jgi:cephalosporin-C deacetylase-like acetyl esterase
MNISPLRISSTVKLLLALILVSRAGTSTAHIIVSPDKPTGVYQVGETVHWTFEWKGDGAPGAAKYKVLLGGLTPISEGDVTFSGKTATIDSKLDAPGTLLIEVRWQPNDFRNRATAGVVAGADKIKPAAERPADFDAFWKEKLKELAKVPANPKLEPADGGKVGVAYWKVTLDNIRGSHILGQVARPEKPGKFPALFIPQWAGVYPLQKGWVSDRAAEGWLALNIQAHDLPIDNPQSFYNEQAAGPLRNYVAIGNDDRETSYFLRMYLSCYQAIEYLKTRDDWDGKTLVVAGTSQGGMQTMMIAGLHPKDITAALALVPAGCDMLGKDARRMPGWPQWVNYSEGKDPKKVTEASRYFDVVNFSRYVKCPMLIGIGLRDEACPPASILAAINEIRSKTQAVLMPLSGHQNENGSQNVYNELMYGQWLPALRQEKAAPVNQNR